MLETDWQWVAFFLPPHSSHTTLLPVLVSHQLTTYIKTKLFFWQISIKENSLYSILPTQLIFTTSFIFQPLRSEFLWSSFPSLLRTYLLATVQVLPLIALAISFSTCKSVMLFESTAGTEHPRWLGPYTLLNTASKGIVIIRCSKDWLHSQKGFLSEHLEVFNSTIRQTS